VTFDRPVPATTDRTEGFWKGGEHGELRIARCQTCGWWLHPPLPLCRQCHGRDIQWEKTSGRGTVWSFTINRYKWAAGMEPPYVIAEVELDEQDGLRVLTSLVDCDEVEVGMKVGVRFERTGDVWVPVFAP
jgi:uncharacterized OB-fold protein